MRCARSLRRDWAPEVIEEVLGRLLPEACAEEMARLRRMITALRLLREDARTSAGRRAPPSWSRARAELEALERRQRRAAIDALLSAHLAALRPTDSFLDLGPVTLAYDHAWRTLLAAGGTPRVSFPPAPAEPPLAVVARLLDAGEDNGAPPDWRAWWGACSRHVAAPAVEAERHWESVLRSARGDGARPPFLARILAGLVAARLERFRPAQAWALHDPHGGLAAFDPGLQRLLGWSALLCGEDAHARRLLGGVSATVLPGPLAELREDWPAWAALLVGPCAPPAPAPSVGRTLERAQLGALLLGVFALRPGAATEILALDAPGELRAEAERRCRAGWRPAVLGQGTRLCRRRRTSGQAELPDSLGGEGTRALAVAAVRDREDGPAGWIQVESAHQLLPSAATLAGIARAWSQAIVAARGDPPSRACVAAEPALRCEPFAPDDPRAEFAGRLFAALGPPAGRRACWIEPGPRGEARVRAEHGAVLRDRVLRPGGAGILRRALAQRALVRHGGEPLDALHAGAASGLALPLVQAAGACVLGVLVLESARSEALGEREVEAARATLAELEPAWWTTSFRAACRALDGKDVAWEPSGRFLSSLAPVLQAAAGSRAPLLLVGAPGAGRRTLARWLRFRLANAPPECVERASALDLADLGLAAQLELARTAGERERFFLFATAPAHVLCERGQLARELGHLLGPLPLFVPPLCERRDEIPALVRVLAAGVARTEALRPPRFEDQALGDLWRQDWRGNVSELAALVAQLVRACAGRALGSAEVRAALRSRGLSFRARLPSLRPSALDLELALASTRHGIGSENLARAARYLGWDPDTLRTRLAQRARRERRERGASRVPGWRLSDSISPAEPARGDP